MTKNGIKSQIELMSSLLKCVDTIRNNIYNELGQTNDTISNIISYDDIKRNNSPERILNELIAKGYIDSNLNEGEPMDVPVPAVDNMWMTITQKVPGGHLCVGTCTSDFDTKQVYIDYISSNNASDSLERINLALAEVKQGDLADRENNQDIDLYVWSNPYDEDMTDKWKICKADIVSALKE